MYVSKFEEWLYSVEGFGLRAERLAEELSGASTTGNLQDVVNSWLQAAFETGRESMRQECIKLVYGMCESDNVAARTVEAIRKIEA